MRLPTKFPSPLIPFSTEEISLELVGGKGLNLAILSKAGFSVPEGFIIPTPAYLQFLEVNQLGDKINATLSSLDYASPDALETASGQIRQLFSEGEVSEPVSKAIEQGWQQLGKKPVAVRSSATAEDLPEMSFAGQQDTFLNVADAEQLQRAVVSCWSSLWTARAIGYRHRNQIPQTDVSLSVVVQIMVESESSGVMFTANPLTGLRREVVINATFGLGEALVSGQVEPDHYVFNTQAGSITEKKMGAKALVIQVKEDGGIFTHEEDKSSIQALPDEAILQLASTGKQIEALYEFPQDIEWAWKDGEIFVLQSRPITSLYPIPARDDDPHLRVYFSFGAVQGILGPVTPLGMDAIRLIFSGGASLFGYNHDHRTQLVIWSAGERLWADMAAIIRHPIGSKLILKLFPGVEPGSLGALETLISDPVMEAGSGKLRLATFRKIFKFYRSLFRIMRKHFPNPEQSAIQIRDRYDQELDNLISKYSLLSGNLLPLADLPKFFWEIRNSFIYAIPEIMAGAMVGLVQMLVLNRFSKRLTGSGELVLELTRGLPNNVTTEMDLMLWESTQLIRSDQASLQHISSSTPERLADDYLKRELPEVAQEAISQFLKTYGMRGLGEIDIGRVRWRENPVPVIQTIQSYLKIEDPNSAPDVVFKRGEESAARAQKTLEELARKTLGGKMKARIIRVAARRLRALAGLRESPKFYIVQKFGLIRQAFLDQGDQLVEQGKLKQKDDLFFLVLDELDQFVQEADRDWNALIEQRRQNYTREMRRKQIPRMLVSDGRAFYNGISSVDPNHAQFKGSPVSPGTVEGTVRVVLDPNNANLSPGEILVCPGTDPAWTPLFLAAGGLVMEVGGLMTHGAIVAREYGIPAVVGVNSATEILKTGDRIRVDGSTGIIERC
jgi:pyruvate,water dikinase